MQENSDAPPTAACLARGRRSLALTTAAPGYNEADNRRRKMTAGSNVAAHIAYDDLREWLAQPSGSAR